MRSSPCPALSEQIDELAHYFHLANSQQASRGTSTAHSPTTARAWSSGTARTGGLRTGGPTPLGDGYSADGASPGAGAGPVDDAAAPAAALGRMDAFMWGGKMVWQSGAETPSTSLGPVLSAIVGGADTEVSRAQYIERTLHPLLINMVVEAIRVMPPDPAHFFLEWLLRHLEIPDTIATPVMRWNMKRRVSVASSDDFMIPEAPEDIGTAGGSSFLTDNPSDPAEKDLRPSITSSILKKPGSGRSSRKATRQPSFKFEPEVLAHEINQMLNRDGQPHRTYSSEPGTYDGSRRRRSSVRIVTTPIEEIKRTLARVPYIKELDRADISAIAETCTVRAYDAQSEIMQCGDISNELLVVMSGRCRVLVPEFKKLLNQGDCFNEACLLKGEAAAEAMLEAAPNTDVQVLAVSMKDMEALGIHKKILRKQKKTSESHYIGRPTNTADLLNRSASVKQSGVLNFDDDDDADGTDMDHALTEKSAQDLDMIMTAVARNQLTEMLQLSEEQIHELANNMYMKEYKSGTTIIRKGDRGEHFYCVRDGCAELISNPDPQDPCKNARGTVAINFRSGSSFGELALLYNAPRKATIVAARDTSLWVLDLAGWRNVLSKMPSSRLEIYVSMLSAVPEVAEAVPLEDKRSMLADCLEEVYYRDNEQVVAEDTLGFTLYIVLDGTCMALKDDQKVRDLKKGDYFGQAALFSGEPYEETIVVTSDHATILSLDRETCSHLALNIDFAEPSQSPGDPSMVVASRRHSIMHKAVQEASSKCLGRLETKRNEIPMSRLERVGVLGAGAFAVVSLVYDPVGEHLYALKAMSKQAIVDQHMKGTVVGERNALAELRGSPFVVELVTTYKDNDCIYLLLEPALGGELFELYNDLDWYGDDDKAAFFTSCVALGIDHIHSKKIIHRDIKLENILLDERGYAKVTDLGIAKVVIGKTYTVCGTSDYLAPETLKQTGHNRAVDWWALGVLAFAMMAGRMPFDADDVLQIYKNIVKGFRKEHFPSSFSSELTEFIKAMCKKKPQERITMLPGGIRNLATHPWIEKGDPSRWESIQAQDYEPSWVPEQLDVEARRTSMKQSTDVEFPEYCDDGTAWDDPW